VSRTKGRRKRISVHQRILWRRQLFIFEWSLPWFSPLSPDAWENDSLRCVLTAFLQTLSSLPFTTTSTFCSTLYTQRK